MQDDKMRILFLPDKIMTEASFGDTFANAAAGAGVKLGRHCGAAGACGKCRVKIEDSSIAGPITATEERLLSKEEIAVGIRLSCCAQILGSGIVQVVDVVRSTNVNILEAFSDTIDAWDADKRGYGVSVDIGTTTVVCYLFNLENSKNIDRISFLNPQVTFGDDVISRIAYSSAGEDELKRIQRVLVDEMDSSIAKMASKNGIAFSDIREIVVAGNTVMEHLFVGVSPKAIGRSPYKPEFLLKEPFPAKQIGMKSFESSSISMLPNVAGYVGADIVAGVAALYMNVGDSFRLLVDIGTNNEIVIAGPTGMFCCATAAGPALEGARIQYGMRASAGAIEKVYMDCGKLKYKIIGDIDPKGVCGSGLIDAIALLIDEGIIERSGRFMRPENCQDERFQDRLSLTPKGMVQILLTDEAHPVYLTQKDVREVQLAVGAVKVGVDVMLERACITKDKAAAIYLAGAFGNNINIESAVKVGLIPDIDRNKIIGVKNSSGLGASKALASRAFYINTIACAENMTYVELSSLKDFQKRFVGAMSF